MAGRGEDVDAHHTIRVMAGRGDEALLRADVPAIHVLGAATKQDVDAHHTIRVMAGRATKLCFAPTSRAIHVLGAARRTWMPGTSPGMTEVVHGNTKTRF